MPHVAYLPTSQRHPGIEMRPEGMGSSCCALVASRVLTTMATDPASITPEVFSSIIQQGVTDWDAQVQAGSDPGLLVGQEVAVTLGQVTNIATRESNTGVYNVGGSCVMNKDTLHRCCQEFALLLCVRCSHTGGSRRHDFYTCHGHIDLVPNVLGLCGRFS